DVGGRLWGLRRRGRIPRNKPRSARPGATARPAGGGGLCGRAAGGTGIAARVGKSGSLRRSPGHRPKKLMAPQSEHGIFNHSGSERLCRSANEDKTKTGKAKRKRPMSTVTTIDGTQVYYGDRGVACIHQGTEHGTDALLSRRHDL